MNEKEIHIIGGGTVFHVRPHFAVCAPAYGTTAKKLFDFCKGVHSRNRFEQPIKEIKLHLTKMAGGSQLETNEDVSNLLDKLIEDPAPKIIFMPVALCDYDVTGLKGSDVASMSVGKNFSRLKSRNGNVELKCSPADKLISKIRKDRKNIFLVGFKTTFKNTEDEMFQLGMNLLKSNSCNLVLVNDIFHRKNMILTPEMTKYGTNLSRNDILVELAEMALKRSQGTFHRTTVSEEKDFMLWEDSPVNLQKVVNYCVEKNAYKPFNNVTVGHFGYKQAPDILFSSRRKQNYNLPDNKDLVKVIFKEGKTTAMGAKPSAGVRSQFLLLEKFPKYNLVVHFHCPLKPNSSLTVREQKSFECGSLECGQNTVEGIKEYEDFAAVMLDKHGPNIIFNDDTDVEKLISFIDENFDLSKMTE